MHVKSGKIYKIRSTRSVYKVHYTLGYVGGFFLHTNSTGYMCWRVAFFCPALMQFVFPRFSGPCMYIGFHFFFLNLWIGRLVSFFLPLTLSDMTWYNSNKSREKWGVLWMQLPAASREWVVTRLWRDYAFNRTSVSHFYVRSRNIEYGESRWP